MNNDDNCNINFDYYKTFRGGTSKMIDFDNNEMIGGRCENISKIFEKKIENEGDSADNTSIDSKKID